MIYEQRRSHFWIFLCIALLINGIVILCLLIIQWKHSDTLFYAAPQEYINFEYAPPPPVTPAQPDEQQDAQLTAGNSLAGVTDTFQDIPEFTPGITSNQADDRAASEQENNFITNQEQQKVPEPKSLATETQPQEQGYLEAPQIQPQSSQTLPQTQAERTKATRHTSGRGKKNASPVTRQGLTFADLARGFINSQGSGKDYIDWQGKGDTLSERQLKMHSFQQKLQLSINSAFHAHPHTLPVPPDTHCVVTITLNKEGTAQAITLAQSSGISSFDEHVLMALRDFKNSFAPLPAHLQMNTYTFNVQVFARRLFHFNYD